MNWNGRGHLYLRESGVYIGLSSASLSTLWSYSYCLPGEDDVL